MDQRQGVLKPGMILTKLEPVNYLLYPPVTVGSSAVMAMLSSRWMLVCVAATFLGFLNCMVSMRAAHK
jgi:ABC-type siderophore export system fused ATPase/permease subunit